MKQVHVFGFRIGSGIGVFFNSLLEICQIPSLYLQLHIHLGQKGEIPIKVVLGRRSELQEDCHISPLDLPQCAERKTKRKTFKKF